MALELHSGEEVIYDGHPSWRSIKAFYATGFLIALALGAIFWFAASNALGVAVFVVVFALAILTGLVRRIFTVFTITTDRLIIRRGILSKRVQQTRIDRVQNVNTRQSPIDRLFRVGAVDFDTAGTDDSDFTFDGVNDPAGVATAVDHAQRRHSAERQQQGLPTDGLS